MAHTELITLGEIRLAHTALAQHDNFPAFCCDDLANVVDHFIRLYYVEAKKFHDALLEVAGDANNDLYFCSACDQMHWVLTTEQKNIARKALGLPPLT